MTDDSRRFLTAEDVPEVIGDTSSIQSRQPVECECRTTPLPLRTVDATLAWIRECLVVAHENGCPPPPPDMDVQTYRCPKCKRIVLLTMAGLGLVVE